VLNQFVIVGRLVNSPKLRKGEKGNVTEITLAVPRSYKNKDGNYDADFIDCAFWDHNAEYVSKMSKGNELAVQGRTETRLYEKDGKKQKDYKVVVDSCKNLDKTKENSNEMDM